MYVCLDIDPSTNRVLGSRAQGDIIETDQPVLLEQAIFGDDGVIGYIVTEKVKFKKPLASITRNDEGEIYTADGKTPLLTAAYALISPRSGIKYTNEVPR
jgi:hypothetical protein